MLAFHRHLPTHLQVDEKTRKMWTIANSDETANAKGYQQQLINLNRSLFKKRLEDQKRQYNVIFSMTMPYHVRQNLFAAY